MVEVSRRQSYAADAILSGFEVETGKRVQVSFRSALAPFRR